MDVPGFGASVRGRAAHRGFTAKGSIWLIRGSLAKPLLEEVLSADNWLVTRHASDIDGPG